MEYLEQINDRDIYYLFVKESENWQTELPINNWLALPIGHDKDIKLYSDFSEKCLMHYPIYTCAIGDSSELIHDIFDETIGEKEIELGDEYENSKFYDIYMTTWDVEFDEGIYFAINSAFHDNEEIEKIIVIDLTEESEKEKVIESIVKIKTGYIPDY